MYENKLSNIYFVHSELTDEDIAELKLLAPDAAVLTTMELSDTDSATESDTEAGDLPEPLVALYDANLRCLCKNQLQERSEETFEKLRMGLTNEQCVNLELTTKNQAQSQAWHTHRNGRITSTTLHRVYTVVTETAKLNLVKQVMHYNKQDLSHVPAVLWGRDMEDTARRQYTEIMKAQHSNFEVELCGLVVRPDKPHLGASPDGIANCTCCGKATLEIKCPYKYRDGLTGSSEDTQFCLDKALQLKKNHEYYHQVQLHMFVCNTQYCDFVVWTKQVVAINRITRDEEMLQAVLPKAEKFFKQSILPELLTRSMDPLMQSPTVCSHCQRPDFGMMIDCAKCKNHFHYTCARVRRKVVDWCCEQCKNDE
jgi:putative phage-type endonuclease